MNEASRKRLDLARRIAPAYTAFPDVRILGVGGSAAKGTSDAFSDIDILVYWDRVDADKLQEPPMEKFGARRFTFRPTVAEDVLLEQYFIGNLKIDVGHLPLKWWEEVVESVLTGHDTNSGVQDMLNGFLSAVIFHGDELYQQWRERIAAYPDELAVKMVRENLFVYPTWIIRGQGVERNDPGTFYEILIETVKRFLAILAGVNRRYFWPGKLKHIEEVVQSMPLAPPDAASRIPRLLTGDPQNVPQEIERLTEELFDLVEQQMPEVDVAKAREFFRRDMQPWEGEKEAGSEEK